jgi:Na+/proline symporter
MKLREFLRREGQIALVFAFIILAINVLPKFFSMNKEGDIYERYYEHALPISFSWIMVALLALRFLVVFGNFCFSQEEKKGH